MLMAVPWTVGILACWFVVFLLAGEQEALSPTSMTIAGSLITVSALVGRHYALNEVLRYLAAEQRFLDVAKKFRERLPEDQALQEGVAKFSSHTDYIRQELRIVSWLPVMMIGLLGVAWLSGACLPLRLLALAVMLFLLVYLAVAADTSIRMAGEVPFMEATASEAEHELALASSQDAERA